MMTAPRKQDAYHKMQLYRLLTHIADNQQLASQICFKGGTCASMLGYLNRFSVDLDFDQLASINQNQAQKALNKIFKQLELEIKDQSQTTLQFLLKYPAPANERNTIQLDMVDQILPVSDYQAQYLPDIDRYLNCHTIETMFANKLIALTDRYDKHQSIAARDLYDIHHFFSSNYIYKPEIITHRTNLSAQNYLQKLVGFIKTNISQIHIDQDLNTILPTSEFQKIRATIKQETLLLLNEELKRLQYQTVSS